LGLQTALNKIVAHPMLAGDPDLRLFLESDTFHLDVRFPSFSSSLSWTRASPNSVLTSFPLFLFSQIKQRKIEPVAVENKGFLANLSSSISGPKFVEHDPVRPILSSSPYSVTQFSSLLPQYFEERKLQLDIFETQLRSLLTSLASASKARQTLASSLAELEAAFLALAQCDLSSTLRKLMDQAAGVQRKIHDLAEQQSAQDEQMGGLVSVVESYARLCASAKVRYPSYPSSIH
jgi:sorting nexin-1/2